MPGSKSKKSKKSKSSPKEGSGTKFGKIFGSLIGKGYSNDEAAAIAYKAIGESHLAESIERIFAEYQLRESKK